MIKFTGYIEPKDQNKVPVRVLEVINALAPKVLGIEEPNITQLATLAKKLTGRDITEAHFIMLSQTTPTYITLNTSLQTTKPARVANKEEFENFVEGKKTMCLVCKQLFDEVWDGCCDNCWDASNSHSAGPSRTPLIANLCDDCTKNAVDPKNLFEVNGKRRCHDCHKIYMETLYSKEEDEIPDKEQMERWHAFGMWGEFDTSMTKMLH